LRSDPTAVLVRHFLPSIANIRIDLSTTSIAPDALSTTFANNVGANDVTVFNGSLSLSSLFTGPAGGPKAFDIVINLTTPFAYNPASGNLLLDVRDVSGASAAFFMDAQSTLGDSVSRAFTDNSGTVNDATGVTDTLGLVTQFTLTPVPEPGTMFLLAAGVLGACRPAKVKPAPRLNNSAENTR
jgi:hypothetical protein